MKHVSMGRVSLTTLLVFSLAIPGFAGTLSGVVVDPQGHLLVGQVPFSHVDRLRNPYGVILKAGSVSSGNVDL